MTKYRAVLSLILIAPVLLGCSGKPTTYTVKIEQKGADGATVSDGFENYVNGVCNTAEGGGLQAHEVTGAGNFTASFEGTFISCTVNAKNAFNSITMTITKADGSVVGTQTVKGTGAVVVTGS